MFSRVELVDRRQAGRVERDVIIKSRRMTTLRIAARSDASELARLLNLLGHPTSAGLIEQVWDAWAGAGNSALVAGAEHDRLAGVITLHQMTVLHRPRPVGRITALVVDEHLRGRGIGHELVAAAERTLSARGCGLVEITSNFRWAGAHAFYERLGYERTSVRLAKPIS